MINAPLLNQPLLVSVLFVLCFYVQSSLLIYNIICLIMIEETSTTDETEACVSSTSTPTLTQTQVSGINFGPVDNGKRYEIKICML